MDIELKQLILASLFHDIGKLIERTEDVRISDSEITMYKYSHAASTYSFLDKHLRSSGELSNLAANHHNPSNFLEWIIAKADRHSAGHERYPKGAEDDIIHGKERRPLQSVIERIKNKDIGIEKPFHCIYPADISGADIYPSEYEEKKFISQYQTLRELFINHLSIFNDSIPRGSTYTDFNNAYRSIMFRYLWSIPDSARREELPDVSLYEHSRITAMLAACLYKYHKDHGTEVPEAVDNDLEEKYLMVGADISGIQKFIFSTDSKGAYKSFKGRSFFMQILPFLIARRILDEVDMDENQIIYLTGGHFYLMLPNIEVVRNAVSSVFDQVNLELYLKFSGSIYVRGDFFPLSPVNLMKKDFGEIWDEFTRNLAIKDNSKYSTVSEENYEIIFKPENNKKDYLNELFLSYGASLRDGNDIVSIKKTEIGTNDSFCGYTIAFHKKFPNNFHKIILLNPEKFPEKAADFFYLPIGGLSKFDSEFDEIARHSRGSNLLGILRMDVDNLGVIFKDGFKQYRGSDNTPLNYYSISRVTTLSTLLILFFSSYIDKIMNEKYRDKAVVVYSGGDDLFILGQWDIIPELAIEINNSFNLFTCNNPAFTLSGGISITQGKYPVSRAAEHAGQAEELAKGYERRGVAKNAVTFMGKPFNWEEFKYIANNFIDPVFSLPSEIRRPLIKRINLVAFSYEKIKTIKSNKDKLNVNAILDLIQAERWQWLMVYSFSRLKLKTESPLSSKLIKDIQNYFIGKNQYNEMGAEKAEVIGRWLENLTRESTGRTQKKGGINA